MSDLERLKLAIQQSSDLSMQGQDEKASALLDESLSQAVRENRTMWIRILSHHAAVISNLMGDPRRARQYYEQSLAANADNPMALYGLAKTLHRQGETDLAKEYATRCYRSIQHGGELDQGLLGLLVASWPEFGKGSG